MFVTRLNSISETNANLDLLSDANIMSVVQTLSFFKISFKEEHSMDDLNRANKVISKLQDKDVRIIYLPPMTVASVHIINGDYADKAELIYVAEAISGELLDEFVKNNKLTTQKPDLRHFGFNQPMGEYDTSPDHGYERWVTIPDDMQVKPPFIKKQIPGGLYAAHMIAMCAFEEWE